MEKLMINKYERTTMFVIDKELWQWVKYHAETLGYASASEYLFDLAKLDREKDILNKNKNHPVEG